jgi:N-acyl-L-homoserine lactone synthetase
VVTIVHGEQNLLMGIFRLRYEVYVKEKRWARDFGNQMERDNYDEYAGYIALTQDDISGGGTVVATARFISLEKKVMLDEEFHELVADVDLIREGAIEITRIAIDKKYRNQHLDMRVYQKLIQWSLENQINHWYFVVEPKYLRYLNRCGIMAVQIGTEKVFADGVKAIAAYIDLKQVLQFLKSYNYRLYQIVAA